MIAVKYVDLDQEVEIAEIAAEEPAEERPRRGRRSAPSAVIAAAAEEAVEEEPKRMQRGHDRESGGREERAPRDRNDRDRSDRDRNDRNSRGRREEEPIKEKKAEIPAPFDKEMEALVGTMSSKILDENNTVIAKMPVRDLADTLKAGVFGAKSIVFDGVISQRIVDLAADQGIENLIGLKNGNVVKMPTAMKVFTAQ
jgi:hypothetical protein